jgi:hypothetical protein
MTANRLAALFAVAMVSLSMSPVLAQDFLSAPLTRGVYMCRDQAFTPTYTMMFGLLDDSTYINYDGHVGTYAYDSTTGVLEIGLEKGAPSLFARIEEKTFRAMSSDGTLQAHVCPFNAVKDPANPPW